MWICNWYEQNKLFCLPKPVLMICIFAELHEIPSSGYLFVRPENNIPLPAMGDNDLFEKPLTKSHSCFPILLRNAMTCCFPRDITFTIFIVSILKFIENFRFHRFFYKITTCMDRMELVEIDRRNIPWKF